MTLPRGKKDELRIFELAYHDPLTGLLNRHSFKEHLNQALEQAKRHGRLVATLFLDPNFDTLT
ncbi:MAG: GGDEF domain-containing protein [Syntrophobacteraceae bacterium]